MENKSLIIVKHTDQANFIIFNRAEKRNALNREMRIYLKSLFEAKDFIDKPCHIMGRGPCFCAGLDLSEEINEVVIKEFDDILNHFKSHNKLTVWIDGIVKGGGVILAAASDNIKVSPDSVMAMPNPKGISNSFIREAILHYAGKFDLVKFILSSENLKVTSAELETFRNIQMIKASAFPQIDDNCR